MIDTIIPASQDDLRVTAGVPQEPANMDREKIRSSHNYDGVHIREHADGRIVVLVDPKTHHVKLNTGEGTRGNTHDLYQVIEITQRPASGTQILERSNAPTKYDLERGL